MINIAPKLITGEREDGKTLDRAGYSQALKDAGVTHEEAKAYWSNVANSDPYAQASKEIAKTVSAQAPKIAISNGKMTISAPQEVLDSPVVKQLQEELKSLKGADLNSAEVANAVQALNDEVQTTFSNAAIEQTFGWTPEEFNDYQYAIQSVSGTNPMKSTNKIKGYDKDGNVVEKTPQEWVKYYQENYNVDERTDALTDSAQSNNPYARTMSLVLMQGHDSPVYGFSATDRAQQGLAAFGNQMLKLPEGIFRLITEDNNTKRVESLAKDMGITSEALRGFNISNEERFDAKKKELQNKSWSQLSDDDKAFLLLLGVSKENNMVRDVDRGLLRDYKAEDLSNLSSENEAVSREAINHILANNSFDSYKETRDNYDTWQGYEQDRNKDDERLAKNAIWSSGSQGLGNLAGIVGRYFWEAALLRAATGGLTGGGFNVNATSDVLGEGIINGLAKIGISPASPVGQKALDFTARLVGTIPEDILQTSIDNVVTYNADENENLFDPEQMSENFRNNLVVMALFNGARAGFSSLRRARMAKQLAKQADLDTVVNIEGINTDVDDLARAIKNGRRVEVSDEKVSVIDENGNEKELKNITPEQGQMVQNTLFDMGETKIDTSEMEAPKVDTTKIEVDTPDGKAIVDAPDYRPRDLSDALSIRVEPTPAGLKNWHIKSLDAVMSAFQNELQEFRNRFNNVQVSDFDWVWYNTKNGLSPEKIIGTTDPTTGRTVTPEMIDAMKWWSENVTKDLRRASREALGLEGDLDVLGYLPHTNYDPTNMSFDEAMTGRLWQTATGSSVLGDDNLYKGFGGTFENRYRTFASNMLWDAKNADVATAKLLEEAQLEGREITPELVEEARRATEGQKNIQQKVNESPSTKELTDALSSDAEEVDWGKIDENTKKQGENSGLGKAIHDNYSEVYSNANTAAVTSQQNSIAQNFDTLGNTMRKTVIGNGMSLYDWGGADLVYAPKNAVELVDRYMREGGDLRAMLTEYVENHSHRSSKYAQAVADKWIAKLGEIPGELTKGKVIYSLGNSMKWEAMGRIRKWLVMADYDKFNDATKKTIDRFLFNHMQMESVKGNRTIGQKLTKALDTLTGLRYRALFYGNIKNALLQTSELNRYFSAFKWGDVATMAKRLATDEGFRARVDTYVDAVAPTTSYLDAELYGKFSDAADSMEVEKNGVKFKDMGKKTKEAADAIGLGPIEAAESFKNRMMVAGLVQEADRLGLTGDEALRHIRRRFERVALAADEMGRIGLSSNPMAKTMLFLQNFQIRELGMHLYNISDEWKLGKTVPKKVYNATKYLTKVFGAKLATTLILARLGYSASQTMGLDPFGLLDSRYTGLDEEEMNDVDKMISGGVLTPFFSGGMTSLIADMYFMARKAYEDSVRQTVTDEAEATLEPSYGLRMPELTFEDVLGGAEKFVPGNVLFNRIGQMNEMMDTGWATSATGNKMYTAPTDPLNIALGYLFGRSATQNAQQYNQSYGDNLSQTLERILGVFDKNRDYQAFDPIDTVNYSDWFKGNDNDLQQFNIGLRYFRNERDRIIDAYEDAIRRGYSQSEDSDAKNNMNNRLNELYDKLDRFMDAYERRNGTIDANMTKQIVNVLNTGRKVLGDTEEEASERSLAAYSDALARYASRGFSPVGTYTGPTEAEPDKEVKYQGSPQYRTAVSGYYDKDDELVDVLKLADKSLEPIRKQLQSRVSAAYDSKDYTTLESIQQQYLKQFDQVVAPIVAIYGVDTIKKNGEVENQLKAMLSSGSLIPSSQYAKNKKGRYQSMPYEEVDVGAWARQRYGSDTYKNPSVRSNSTAQEDLSEVKQLLRQGKTSLAKAKALRLKVRIEGQKQALPQQDLTWLNNYLTGKGYN